MSEIKRNKQNKREEDKDKVNVIMPDGKVQQFDAEVFERFRDMALEDVAYAEGVNIEDIEGEWEADDGEE